MCYRQAGVAVRCVVLGASGGVGRAWVEAARRRGHDVVAVARGHSEAPTPVLRADILTDPLEPLLIGVDVVFCAIGHRRRQRWNPWSAPTSPVDLNERVALRLVNAMRHAGVKRVIAISAAGVGDSAAGLHPLLRPLIATSSIGVAYRDLERMEEVLLSSGLDACCVRPVTLIDGAPTGRVREVGAFTPAMWVRRADVAAYGLDRCARDRVAGTPQIAGA